MGKIKLYSDECIDAIVNYLVKNSKYTQAQIREAMKTMSDDDYQMFLFDGISHDEYTLYTAEIWSIPMYYMHSIKFLINDIDEIDADCYKDDKLDFICDEDNCFIDFEYNGDKYTILYYKRAYPVTIRNKDYVTQVYIFCSNKAMHKTAMHDNCLFAYKILFTEDANDFIVEIPNCYDLIVNNVWSVNKKFYSHTGITSDSNFARAKYMENDFKRIHIAPPSVIVNVLKYVSHSYKNRYKYVSSKAKTSTKVTAMHNIHVAHETKEFSGVVSLFKYVKEYEPSTRSEYKGGHHASPTPHERVGFYRRSRGKGDYDLIDDEFVFVGKGLGKYSYVSPTTVGMEKDEVVYKV